MSKKGQALVEFVLIMPIILLVLMFLIDIGNIFVQKINLNNSINVVSELYKNDEKQELLAYVAKEDLTYSEKEINNMIELTLKKNIRVSAPVLSNILGKNYNIDTSTTIYKGDKNE